MSHFGCPDLQELAAELALNVVSGEERAHALSHLAQCGECRALVDEVSRTADSMLMLAPQVEPPIGFESRVVARIAPRRRRMPSWRWTAAAAVLAMAASAGTGALVHSAGDRARQRAAQYDRLVQAIGGKTLRAAELRSLDGTVVGKVYAAQGKPSWLFLVLEDREGTGEYEVQLEPVSGEAIRLAGLQLKAGRASWATTAAIQVENIQSVQIVDSTGAPLYDAEFQKPSK